MIRRVRKGFTLVELLIVIVIIGILAAAMLLSSGSASASAEASNIVNGLTSLRSAVAIFATDNLDFMNTVNLAAATYNDGNLGPTVVGDAQNRQLWEVIRSHMDNPGQLGRYALVVVADGSWWVQYTFPAGAANAAEIQRRLAPRAQSLGLYAAPVNRSVALTLAPTYVAPGNVVARMAR